MMNNKNVKITVTREKDFISVSAEIPEMNPRKGIDHIRYDVVNARQSAVEKYGDSVGNLTDTSPNPVLENKLRSSPPKLVGTWIFATKGVLEGKRFASMKTVPTKTRTRKTSRRRTKTTSE